MARYTGPIQKKLRSLGLETYGAYGTRSEKKANQGFTGRRRRVSAYGLQLKEKQKAKFIYGILERQFKNYYDKALFQDVITGDNLIILLERRLDNFASSGFDSIFFLIVLLTEFFFFSISVP